jgi:hypothetical protein
VELETCLAFPFEAARVFQEKQELESSPATLSENPLERAPRQQSETALALQIPEQSVQYSETALALQIPE